MAKTKVITLSEAIELKQTIQELLNSKRNIFKLENCAPKGSKRNYDLKKVLKEIQKLQEWFVFLKREIQKANLIVLEDEEFDVSSIVYELSETKNDILAFESALKKPFWKRGIHPVGNSELEFEPLYKEEKIEDWLSVLRKKHTHYEAELDRLNELITVSIYFDLKDL